MSTHPLTLGVTGQSSGCDEQGTGSSGELNADKGDSDKGKGWQVKAGEIKRRQSPYKRLERGCM